MPYKKLNAIIEKNNYKFFHTKSTTSTMNDVKNYLNLNDQNCIFLSNKQSKGRGRRGNLWYSPEGNIYCSVGFKNFLEIKDHFLYSILITVTIKEALEKFNIDKIKFKWPNDIYFEDKKFAGLISEVFNISNLKSYMIVGFGINFNSAPDIKNYKATYIKAFCNLIDINDFLYAFFKIFFINLKNFMNNKNDYIIKIFTNSLLFKNKNINISLPNNSLISGKFVGINVDGSLKLEIKKKIINIYNGSIKR